MEKDANLPGAPKPNASDEDLQLRGKDRLDSSSQKIPTSGEEESPAINEVDTVELEPTSVESRNTGFQEILRGCKQCDEGPSENITNCLNTRKRKASVEESQLPQKLRLESLEMTCSSNGQRTPTVDVRKSPAVSEANTVELEPSSPESPNADVAREVLSGLEVLLAASEADTVELVSLSSEGQNTDAAREVLDCLGEPPVVGESENTTNYMDESRLINVSEV